MMGIWGTMSIMHLRFLQRFFISILLAVSPVFLAHAATLSIDPATGDFGPGDTFVLTVRLDLALDECVNAANIALNYPSDWMKASAVSKGESLLTLWPEEPLVLHEKGTVSFSGGIPAGYCGRVEGDPGKTNILGKIVFSIPGNMIGGKTATGSTPLELSFSPDSEVLANDGFGTPVPLALRGGAYVRTLTSSGKGNEWLDIVHGDDLPPDIFTAALITDPKTFQGKYFIVFSTVDKQSGVHHYEVQEDDPARFGMVRGKAGEQALFITATSPYVLRDQELGSRIIIRAIDHAGNVQETILPPKDGLGASNTKAPGGRVSQVWWYALGGVLLALSLVIGVRILRKGTSNAE